MKKMTFLMYASLSFYAFGAAATVISQQDEKSLEKDVSKSLSKSISASSAESFQALSQNALIFESADTKGDIEVEVNGAPVARRVGKAKYKNLTLRTVPYTVNNLAVIKTVKSEDALIIESSKDELLNFRTTRTLKISDANLVDCKGCPEIWSGYTLKSVMTSKDSGDSLVAHQTYRNGRPAGSGMASGRRGHSKSMNVDSSDGDLLAEWMGLFNKQSEKRMELEYTKLDKETLELLKAAKVVRVKVKFPWMAVTTDSEVIRKISISQDSVKIEFAIKENGIK